MDKKKKINKHNIVANNPIEAVGNLTQAVASSVAGESQEIMKGIWDQFLGTGETSQNREGGELTEGEELILSKKKEYIDPGIDWRREIVNGSERAIRQENQTIQYQIEQIVMELKKISETSQDLKIEFAKVTMETVPQNAGSYHLNFFEWMLSTLQAARQRVESSRNWLSVMTSKKGKQGYWNMFKKHGTTFGLSNERVVATQVG